MFKLVIQIRLQITMYTLPGMVASLEAPFFGVMVVSKLRPPSNEISQVVFGWSLMISLHIKRKMNNG